MKKYLIVFVLSLCLTGCMSKYEWLLRQQDMAIKAKHHETYNPLTIRGPISISEGGQITSTVPNFPYVDTPIPDGQKTQSELASKVMNTAGILGAGYFIKRAGDDGDTIINNGGKK